MDVMEDLRPPTAPVATTMPPAARLTPRMPLGGSKGPRSKSQSNGEAPNPDNAVRGGSCDNENQLTAPISSKQVHHSGMSCRGVIDLEP